jgi:DNA-binding protein YbaB
VSSEEANGFSEKTSRLLRGLKIAAAKQGDKTYRGSSKEDGVEVKISGNHQIQEISIDAKHFGLSEKKAKELSEQMAEAGNRALKNSQDASRRAIAKGLEAEQGKKA